VAEMAVAFATPKFFRESRSLAPSPELMTPLPSRVLGRGDESRATNAVPTASATRDPCAMMMRRRSRGRSLAPRCRWRPTRERSSLGLRHSGHGLQQQRGNRGGMRCGREVRRTGSESADAGDRHASAAVMSGFARTGRLSTRHCQA